MTKSLDVIAIAERDDWDGPLRLPLVGHDAKSRKLLERPWYLSIDVVDHEDRRRLVTDSITGHVKSDARLIDLVRHGVTEKQYTSQADRDLGFRLLYWHDVLVPECDEYMIDMKISRGWYEFYGLNRPDYQESYSTQIEDPLTGSLVDYLDTSRSEIMIPMRIDIGDKAEFGGIWASPYRS